MPTEQCNRVLVERYFLGEIPKEQKGPVLHHLDGCADCRGLMATLENDKRIYLLEHPFREFAAKRMPEGKSAPARALNGRWMMGLASMAACLVMLPVLFRSQDTATAPIGETPAGEGIRTKGGTILEYYLKRGDVVTPGSAGEPYRSGDALQFVYAAGGHPYVSLASIDSRGHVSLYKEQDRARGNPQDNAQDITNDMADPGSKGTAPLSHAALEGEKQPLPFAVTLDDSPGSELFVMIYGSGPLSDTAVESWLMEAYTRAAGNLEDLTSMLSPPPLPSMPSMPSMPSSSDAPAAPAGSAAQAPAAGKTDVKTVMIRKTQA